MSALLKSEMPSAIMEEVLPLKRATIIDVLLPFDVDRRNACEADFLRFCCTYFPKKFRNPSEFHIAFCKRLQRAIASKSRFAIKKALAAPRGLGKSTIVRLLIIWCALYKHRKTMLIVCSSGPMASDHLTTIKTELNSNFLLEQDFPEIVSWVHSFGANPQRAGAVGGEWSSNEVKLINGVWIVTVGIEGKVRGMNKDGSRLDLVVIDDIEDEESVLSETTTKYRESVIRKAILKLHEPGQAVLYVMICTIPKQNCIADRFTNPQKEPSWNGERYKALITFPADMQAWDKFGAIMRMNKAEAQDLESIEKTLSLLQLSEDDWESEAFNPGLKLATRYYAKNYGKMNSGAVLIDSGRIPLWSFFAEWYESEKGKETVLCELQNEPPEDDDSLFRLTEGGLLARRIEGLEPWTVPEWADFVAVTIDTGLRRHHWEVNAFSVTDRTSAMIHAGVETNFEEIQEYEGAAVELKRKMAGDAVVRGLLKIQKRCLQGFTKASTGQVLYPYFGVDRRGGAEGKPWYREILLHCKRNAPRWIALRGEALWSEAKIKEAKGRTWLRGKLGDIFYHTDTFKNHLKHAYELPATVDGQITPGARVLHASYMHATLETYCKHQTAEYYDDHKKKWIKEPGKPNHWFDTATQSQVMYEIITHYERINPEVFNMVVNSGQAVVTAGAVPEYRESERNKKGGPEWRIGR